MSNMFLNVETFYFDIFFFIINSGAKADIILGTHPKKYHTLYSRGTIIKITEMCFSQHTSHIQKRHASHAFDQEMCRKKFAQKDVLIINVQIVSAHAQNTDFSMVAC